ncbi:MAG: 50S ribosomal protein L25/general stress protein Ctc [Leptolyngbya sp. IPPAS B-1204]|uniref:Large ribosomal subunit protein bL25 n=1 Tax=Leptolyngbya sp. NK1-12 TaxID=2547451 RepID=A0AA96WDS0_9CYAN|nr:50S ribosomal protein L25/general stress protein Ctc [Leptolyngbya sp. NK1-12]MBF2050016.1 50S ribosomal protein L25/general stress protein Ctc [Elainella sp. C42_A2020_010]RNJ70396.1 MAG: 50S ribosomal protein L25/general stress protein Ctc [Leptolyngbya sp. IPPAS B-1204]WNZ23359.1 50S ribosomal protein L25/general stress protein Ctc [Leptolyngbya sp. NK1-12]
MELTIECQKRPAGSKPNALRRQGLTPAVLYGHNGTESVELTLNTRTAQALVKKASLNNTMIQLNVSDMPWNGKALLREVQVHPWRGDLYHLSFFSVGSQATVQVTVPLHFVGDAIGVKQNGGTLDTVLTELEVICSPNNVPETIEIDVAKMDVGDALHVNELPLPDGVTVVGEADRVVVSVLGSKSAATSSDAAES